MADMEAEEFKAAEFPDAMGDDDPDMDEESGGRPRERRRRRRRGQEKTAEELATEKLQRDKELHDAIHSVRQEAKNEADSKRYRKSHRLDENGNVIEEDPESTENAEAGISDDDQYVKDISDFIPKGVIHDTNVPESIGSQYYFSKMVKFDPQNPSTPAGEAAFVSEIVKNYDWKPNTGGMFFLNVGSTIFNREFEKTAMSYVRMERGEFPILIYDSSVRNTGKYGFVLTNRYFHFSTRDFIPYKLKLSKLQYLKLVFGDTINDWTILYFKQKGMRGLIPAFQTLSAGRALEVADVIMKMAYHLTPDKRFSLNFEVNGVMPYKRQKTDNEKGLRGIWEAILDIIFNRSPAVDVPGRTWTAEYHLAKINQKRKAAGLDMISLDDLKQQEEEKAAAEKAAEEEAAKQAEAEAAAEDGKDKKGKKGKKDKKDKKDKGKDKPEKEDKKKDKKKGKK